MKLYDATIRLERLNVLFKEGEDSYREDLSIVFQEVSAETICERVTNFVGRGYDVTNVHMKEHKV